MAVKKDPRLVELLDGRGPGAHLRKVREEANMSVDKVASALLLHPHTVEALEADAYERLPAPTFVRGYLRGYARVLGLPSRPILEMFDRQGFEPPPLSPDVTEAQQAHTSDTAVRLVTYAVGAVLVVLVGLWWHSQEDGGFGISSGLFESFSESDRDPSVPADEGTGTAASGSDSVSDFIGTAPDEPDALQPGIEPVETPPDTDAASRAEAGDTAAETEPVVSDLAPRNEESTVAALAGDTASGDLASADAAPADTTLGDPTGTTAALQPNDATVAAASSEPSRNEEPTVTAAVEEVAPGQMDAVAPAPADAPDPGVTENRESSATQVSSTANEAEAGVDADTVADADPQADSVADAGTETGTGGTDGEGATVPDESASADGADASAGTSLAAASVQDSAEATRGSGAALAAGSETAQSGLVLEFVHESWVEVYDHERTRLFFGLVQPGRVLSFDGPQPFDVLLGFGKDVRVAIDGRAFDHTPYLKHGVARFSVGAEVETSDAESPDATPTDTGNPPVVQPVPEDRGN